MSLASFFREVATGDQEKTPDYELNSDSVPVRRYESNPKIIEGLEGQC
jgi:hypothetical protein